MRSWSSYGYRRFGIAVPAIMSAVHLLMQFRLHPSVYQQPLSIDSPSMHPNVTQNVTISYEQSVKALETAVSEALSPEEKRQWYSSPHFTSLPTEKECPEPVAFKRRWALNESNFTLAQRSTLRDQLMNGSATIRDTFLPFIEKGGFHPDLILHSIDTMSLMVGIFDGKVYFGGNGDLKSNGKVATLAQHLESVMFEFHRQGVKIPNVIFPYTVSSFPAKEHTFRCAKYSLVPKHLQDRYDTVPTAGIAMDPSWHSGIALLPNMYFGNIRVWHEYTKQLLAGSKADTPWNKRIKRAFWRGKVGNKPKSNMPRLAALQAAARNTNNGTSPRLLDVALVDGCAQFKNYAKTINATSPGSPPWLPRKEFVKRTRCGGSNSVRHAKFSNYMAQLNLPGSAMASYSKNLQHLWPTGAAVMIWEQRAVEFYYDTLTPGVTHVWVNESTIEPIANMLFENDGELARLMGSVGRAWFSKHLTMPAILDYYKQWFHAWASLQRFTPTPEMIPRACTCAGWSDYKTNKNESNGPRRCSWCAKKYPPDIKKGVRVMMGAGM